MRRGLRLIILVAVGLSLQGSMCAEIYTRKGVWHRVEEGETLQSLSKEFGVSAQRIAHTNSLASSKDLTVGQRILIPAGHVQLAKRSSKAGTTQSEGADGSAAPGATSTGRLAWPVDGRLSSKYGIRNGRRHDGIDIAAPSGSPVKAAEGGEVVYAARLRGYGNMILIKHPGDMFTVYAHNSRNLKKKGDKVGQGEVIARVGSTGRATGPHVH
ncbi:MAG: LysM peptidoglycan-binding domain-containing M23 family metallopeptidase, partial [Kiloniellales bacterium]|nr:LysM peptidoglycan-binding domain-containing M23 family metallopeptidase [Kiloniellales bacterium]